MVTQHSHILVDTSIGSEGTQKSRLSVFSLSRSYRRARSAEEDVPPRLHSRALGTVARFGVVAFWRWITSPDQSSSATAFAFKCRQAAASRRSGSKPSRKSIPDILLSGFPA